MISAKILFKCLFIKRDNIISKGLKYPLDPLFRASDIDPTPADSKL